MRSLTLAALLLINIFNAGCAAALLGGGLIGGIVISDDNVKNTFQAPVKKVWQACVDYLKGHGEIVRIDKDKGIIYAERVFGNKYVEIRVTGKPVGTFVLIKARKTAKLLPDVDTSVRIMTDLIHQLD